MAECPGVLHLAAMADGGLARLRVPGGSLSATQARVIAEAAARMGSGVIDLTNRANLQIRGLSLDAGPRLAAALFEIGLGADGPADRRRNILLDPFSGLDPAEVRDCRPLAQALDRALTQAGWIGALSPKFSFAIDGGSEAGIGAIASDVSATAVPEGVEVVFGTGAFAVTAAPEAAVSALLTIADSTARLGPDARARDLQVTATVDALCALPGVRTAPIAQRRSMSARYGAIPTRIADEAAVAVPVPVGRLDAPMLIWLADQAEAEGDGTLRLAPWSAVVLPGVARDRAAALLAGSEAVGFTPVAVAERLSVVACAGAPACERAREPAKALGAALLALAAEPGRLPASLAQVHLSACAKGCAGSSASDLLLLGASGRSGWSVHRGASPRAAQAACARLDDPNPAEILRLLAARG
ncbi:precorrin-3B synthase [Hansschlegelia plantiphila]|uniref:Oxidoreductase n=1 Tax=Hansschlegelia plantiphila TaxID=374655 RepID=A0A9W6MV32_9HYPH|nr:precorrin-3B synthase [Hansschlegelia plantiphila]GLK67528.1 oxidoreductase [Hansschlegelia plantiphila]